MAELVDIIREMVKFLRKSAMELRQIADTSEPGVAQPLRHIADQCEAEAGDLSERFGID